MRQLDQTSVAKFFTYRRSDLNRQEFPRRILSALRLPIPPRLHVDCLDATRWKPVINRARIVRQAVFLPWHLLAGFLPFRRRGDMVFS